MRSNALLDALLGWSTGYPTYLTESMKAALTKKISKGQVAEIKKRCPWAFQGKPPVVALSHNGTVARIGKGDARGRRGASHRTNTKNNTTKTKNNTTNTNTDTNTSSYHHHHHHS